MRRGYCSANRFSFLASAFDRPTRIKKPQLALRRPRPSLLTGCLGLSYRRPPHQQCRCSRDDRQDEQWHQRKGEIACRIAHSTYEQRSDQSGDNRHGIDLCHRRRTKPCRQPLRCKNPKWGLIEKHPIRVTLPRLQMLY